MLTLLVLQGPDKGQRFELQDDAALVGRNVPGGDLVGGLGMGTIPLTDNTVSRRHCEIANRDGILLLKDLGSANGTYVNGLRVRSPQAIRVGDQLRVGRTLMAFGSVPGVRPGRDGDVEMSGAESGMDSSIMHSVAGNDDSLVLAVPEPTAAAVSNLQILYRLGAALGASFDAGQAMAITLDLVFEHVKAERGVVFLKDEKTGDLQTAVLRTRANKPGTGGTEPSADVPADVQEGAARINASRTIVDHVMRTGQAVLSQNAMEDKRFSKGKSVHNLVIRSALCVPIRARRLEPAANAHGGSAGGLATPGLPDSEVIGVIYIDSSKRNYTYSTDQLRLLSAIGLQAGMALQNAKLYQAAVRAERLAAVGETTAALSHAIKNILQALRGGADVVEMGLERDSLPQARKGWGVVSRGFDRIFGLTKNLLAYSRPRTPQAELVSLATLVGDCVETVASHAAEFGVMVIGDVDPKLPPVPMDEGAVHQVLMNLLGNAIDAVGKTGGLVRITGRLDATSGSGGEAVIAVSDNGPGVAPALRPHLFELFHSTKGNRGTGLGLAVSRKIIEEHDGTIELAATTPGATFVVRLPLNRLAAAGDMADGEPQADEVGEPPAASPSASSPPTSSPSAPGAWVTLP